MRTLAQARAAAHTFMSLSKSADSASTMLREPHIRRVEVRHLLLLLLWAGAVAVVWFAMPEDCETTICHTNKRAWEPARCRRSGHSYRDVSVTLAVVDGPSKAGRVHLRWMRHWCGPVRTEPRLVGFTPAQTRRCPQGSFVNAGAGERYALRSDSLTSGMLPHATQASATIQGERSARSGSCM